MIKHLVLGIWICAVSLTSAYGTMSWQVQQARNKGAQVDAKPEVEQIKTKMLNVPLVRGGSVIGYVLAQFTFTVDAKMLKAASAKPDLFVVDEAFRLIYSGDTVDFGNLSKPDVGGLAAKIKENVNKRLGADLVRDVFVQELSFIPKEQFRGGGPSKK